jgi:hypothetical protein
MPRVRILDRLGHPAQQLRELADLRLVEVTPQSWACERGLKLLQQALGDDELDLTSSHLTSRCAELPRAIGARR